MDISDGELLFFHGVVEGSAEKKNPTREYKTGQFMTDSIIPIQMIVVSQL